MDERIGEKLVRDGLISREQLNTALKLKLAGTRKLGEIFVELGYLSKKQVVKNLYALLSDRITGILRPMAMAESSMARLYDLCAGAYPGNRDFWLGMRDDELEHARRVNKMIEMIYENPQGFEEGRRFNPAAIQTYIDGINSTIEKIKGKALTEDRALFIVRDLENSLIEIKYNEVVKAKDAEFDKVAESISKEDLVHRKKIEAIISAR